MKVVKVSREAIGLKPLSKLTKKKRNKGRKQRRAENLEVRQLDHEKKVAIAKLYELNPTESERLFGEMLDRMGIEHIFQAVIGPYIPDFYFPKLKKIIELDGKYHKTDKERRRKDQNKDQYLRGRGLKILRLESSLVFRNCDVMMARTKTFLLGGEKIPKAIRAPYLKDEATERFLFVTAGL